jgi:uncharacterized surface protein with fasciclin (FAS1) repeats
MIRHRSAEEVRRFDLMKLGVLLLLIVLLFLTWFATRDSGLPDLLNEAEATAVVEATTEAAAGSLTREPGIVPMPTLGMPAITAPTGPLAPGPLTFSGLAGPGAQVRVLADGQPLGLASAGVDGAWSLTAELAAGAHTLVAQTLDNVGGVVAESMPLTVSVGETAPTEEQLQTTFDPLTDRWSLAGVAAPGASIAVLSGGAALGTTTADAGGAWSLDVPAAAVADDLVVQSTDAAGVTNSVPAPLGPRPPAIAAPGEVSTGADGTTLLVVPVGVVVWTGQAAPGTQVEALVDGQDVAVAVADESGGWSLPLDLPAGDHTVQFNSLDAAGVLLAAGQALAVSAGAATVEGPGTPIAEATAVEPTPAAESTPVTDATAIAEATSPAEATPGVEMTPAAEFPADTILAALQGRPELATLLAAVQAAGLAETLTGPGAFTVFAPTNDAFAALPQPVVDALLANPTALSQLLQYHVVRGRHTAAQLRIVQPATLNGRLLTIAPQGDGITVNGAAVLAADVDAGNGLLHVIDRILLPPLAAGVRPPVINESGVPTFVGPRLTVVGTAEPGRTIYVELNGTAFGAPAVVDAGGNWQVSGDVGLGDYRIVAFMVNGATLEAFSRSVALVVR